MRTFHIGGAASSSVALSNSQSPVDGKLKFENIKLIEDKFANTILLSRNGKIKIENSGIEKYAINNPFGSKILVKDGQDVKANQTIAEWDPYTLSLIHI